MSNSGHERNCCYLNLGTGRFANVSSVMGLDHIGDGRAYALADWDHDGDVDVWTTNRTGPRLQFLRNNAADDNNYLAVSLTGNGASTNRDAIGARVEVFVAEPEQESNPLIKTLRAGDGFLSESSKWLTFGLGKYDHIQRILVHWPDGSRESIEKLKANAHYRIAQGSGVADKWHRRQPTVELTAARLEPQQETSEARIPLRLRIPLPEIAYATYEGRQESLLAGRDSRPRVVNFWATWCGPCLQELSAWSQQAAALQSAGVDVIAICVDPLTAEGNADPEREQAALRKMSFPFTSGRATDQLANKFEMILEYLFDYARPWSVPTSLLFDAEGRLAVIYVGPVTVSQLLEDAKQLALDELGWLDRSLPFKGRWLRECSAPHLGVLVNALYATYPADAHQYFAKVQRLIPRDKTLAEAISNAARYVAGLGEHQTAIQLWGEAIRVQPTHAGLQLQLARALRARGRHADALPYMREAVRLQPDNAELHTSLGSTLLSLGQRSEALAEMRTALQLSPTAENKNNLAGVLATNPSASEQETGEAIQLAEEAAQQSQYQHAAILDTLGVAYAAGQRFKEAIDTCEKALKLSEQAGNNKLSQQIRAHIAAYRKATN